MMFKGFKFGLIKIHPNYYQSRLNYKRFFSTQQQHEKTDRSQRQRTAAQDKFQRQKDIQFRKRMLQQAQLKEISNKIRNTKGNFNPLFHYLKIYKNLLIIITFIGSFLCLVVLFANISGTFSHPLTNKKKFLLISKQFEESLDVSLRECLINQIGKLQPISSHSSIQIGKLEQLLSAITKKTYKITLVQAKENIILFLPKTVIMSKNLLMAKNISENELLDLLILMETLFIFRFHIRELNFSYILTYLGYRFQPTNFSEIKMAKIYSRKYKKQQIGQALEYIEKMYGRKDNTFILKNLSQKLSLKQKSPFSLKFRLQEN